MSAQGSGFSEPGLPRKDSQLITATDEHSSGEQLSFKESCTGSTAGNGQAEEGEDRCTVLHSTPKTRYPPPLVSLQARTPTPRSLL